MKAEGRKLRVLYINPAGGCNLHCKHCWVNEGETQGNLLTLDLWKKLLTEAKTLGSTHLKLTGGEPLLYKNIVNLYQFAWELFPNIVIETNGTLQPEGFWEAITANKPYHISISLDSANPKLHDNFRGEMGAWKKTVNFGLRLSENGINRQVIMSISTIDKKPITDMIKLVQKIGIFSLKINFIIPAGRGKSNNFLGNNSIHDTLKFFAWLDNETPEWVLPSIPPALLPINRLTSLGYCPVNNLMGVLPDGTFSLCGVAFSRADMAWGKYPDISVKEAWENSPIYSKIKSSIPNNIEGICKKCIHKNSCKGSCIVNNQETGGSITSPNFLCELANKAGLFPETRVINK